MDKVKQNIIKKYISIAKKKKFHPTVADFIEVKITRHMIRHHFGNLTNLRKIVKDNHPKELVGVFDEALYDKSRFDKLTKDLRKHQRFVVTTAVTGCRVDKKFLKNIDKYCLDNKAQLLVLLATDPAAASEKIVDPVLMDRNIIFKDVCLNDNLFLSTIKLSAKHIDPITGLGRIGQRNGSFIYASPKQRLKMVATSNTKLPHAIMTTGAITKPNYQTDKYMSERTAYIASNDHVMGAIIVEIKDNKLFAYRQIQADKSGAFIDLGRFYKNGEVTEVQPEAFVLGDWHSGDTDLTAKKAWLEVINQVKPKKLVIHDGFDGKSISHHEERNKVLRARRALANNLSLTKELTGYANDLDELAELVDEIIISKSNHDEFLSRYLDNNRHVEDSQNYYLASKLIPVCIEGEDPLKYAMEEVIGLNNKKKIKWLSRDEDCRIAGIEVGAHGDKGANGSRGSLQSMENAYGQSVSGHSHCPEILRGAWSVGTSSKLKLSYNTGPSAWCHSSCLIYANGSRQLINSINGFWRIQ